MKNIPKEKLIFEKAYCYYCLEDMEMAKKILSNTKDSSLRISELLAQIHYNQGKFSLSSSIYKTFKNSTEEIEDRLTNIFAAQSLSFIENQQDIVYKLSQLNINELNYEQVFNQSFSSLIQHEYQQCLSFLNRSEELLKSFIASKNFDESKFQEDFTLIRMQKVFVLSKQGKFDAALELLNNDNIRMVRKHGKTLLPIARNNLLSLYKDQNVFNCQKVYKLSYSGFLRSKKLNCIQKYLFNYNKFINLMNLGKTQEMGSLYETLKASEIPEYMSYLNDIAAVCFIFKEKGVEEAILHIENILKRDNFGVEVKDKLLLILAQLYKFTLKYSESLKCLSSCSEFNTSINMLLFFARSHAQMGNTDEAIQTYLKIIEKGDFLEGKQFVLQELLIFLMEMGNMKLARELAQKYAKKLSCEGHIVESCLKYESVINQKESTMSSAERHNRLIEINMKTEEIFSNTNIFSSQKYGKVTKRKNRRKKKVANYSADKQLDPERWLPMRERSYYKPTKKKSSHQKGGHQGSNEKKPLAQINVEENTSARPTKNKVKRKKFTKKRGRR